MRSNLYFLIASVIALALTTLANAQSSTETYTYDALGRLIKVETVSGLNDGETREIQYDAAGNRLNYEATGEVSLPPPPDPDPDPPVGDPQAALEGDFAGRTNSGMWDLRAATNAGSFSAANITGGLPAMVEIDGTPIEAVSSVTGAKIVNGQQIQVPATGTYAVYLLLRKDPVDTGLSRVIDGTWPNQVMYNDGSTSTAGGAAVQFYSNGAFGLPVANADVLHDTLDDDAFHFVKLAAFSFDSSEDLLIGRRWVGMEADIVAAVALDLSEVSDLAATETLIANWFNDVSPN